ncbi:MAG: head-tail connector protein [Pseudomonadota bacterium]
MMLVEETPVPAAAVPVDALKAHLRLGTGFADDAVQDAVLESFLRAAMAAVEGRTGKILISRDFSWNLMEWGDPMGQVLPVAPVNAVTALVTTDPDGGQTALAVSDLTLAQNAHRPKLVPKGACLPAIPAKGSVTITFTAGFAPDFSGLPDDLAQAILMLAAHYYENRNAVDVPMGSMPFGVAALTERYKNIRILGGAPA